MIKYKLGNNNKWILNFGSIICISTSLSFDHEILLITPPHQKLPQTCKSVSLKIFSEDVCNVILNIHPLDMDVCNRNYFSPKGVILKRFFLNRGDTWT